MAGINQKRNEYVLTHLERPNTLQGQKAFSQLWQIFYLRLHATLDTSGRSPVYKIGVIRNAEMNFGGANVTLLPKS